MIFIDNESEDGSYYFMKEEYNDKNSLLIRNEINNGYAQGDNQGIKLSECKYVMILNPYIIIMETDFIEKIYEFIDKEDSIGTLSVRLLKYDFEHDKHEKDLKQYDKVEIVFWVCGAAPLHRKSDLGLCFSRGRVF